MYCVEFSEVLLRQGKHPFHVDNLKKVIGLNNWSMLVGKDEYLWKIVFVADDEKECHRYVETCITVLEKKNRM